MEKINSVQRDKELKNDSQHIILFDNLDWLVVAFKIVVASKSSLCLSWGCVGERRRGRAVHCHSADCCLAVRVCIVDAVRLKGVPQSSSD